MEHKQNTKEYIEKIRQLNAQSTRTQTAFVRSYGCQLNFLDGDKVLGLLLEMGYERADCAEEADVIIFNTCAVRENAEDRVFGNIGFAKHIKEKRPDVIIGLCGCMAQQEHIAEKIRKSYGFVDVIFGTFAQGMLPELLYRTLTTKKAVCDIKEYSDEIDESLIPARNTFPKASVPIAYGCDNFCTYCVVPYVRGRERSRSPQAIIDEISALASAGWKEFLLLGQNVNSYNGGISFPQLLRKINDIEGDFLIRFMSSHPKDATHELIDTMLECEKVEKHLHLPVQSGSDDILKRMNRNYTVEKYLEIVDYARAADPEFSFSSDVIVGFPDESDEDFQKTLDLIRRVRYDNLYTFIYSKRTGTEAEKMPDSITSKEKSDRMGKLLALQREITTQSYKRFLGRQVRVLCEGESKNRSDFLLGKTPEGIIVEFTGNINMIGKFVNVSITSSKNWAIEGSAVL